LNVVWIVLILLVIYLISKNDPVIANYLKERIEGFKKYADDEKIKVLLPQLETAIEEAQKDNRWSILEIVRVIILLDKIQRRINEINEEEPEPEPEPEPNPYKWVKGILTLNPIPSAKEIWDMGFNVLLPYGYRYDSQKQFIKEYAQLGGKIIAEYKFPKDLLSEIEDSVVAYCLLDEPDCRRKDIDEMEEWVKILRGKTNKPIGCVLCGGDIGCGYGGKAEWIKFINTKLDFVMLSCYPYATFIEEGKEVEEMKRCLEKEWKDIKVPVIPILQAHSGGPSHEWRLREPNPKEQVDFWKEMGYIIYPWKDSYDGVEKHKKEWEDAINE